jgi:hypothetical protein
MRCFLYPDIGLIDEQWSLHAEGFLPDEPVNIKVSMNQAKNSVWSANMCTFADSSGKVIIGEKKGDVNELTRLLWKLSPEVDTDASSAPAYSSNTTQLYFKITGKSSGTSFNREVIRLAREDNLLHEKYEGDGIYGEFFCPEGETNLPCLIVLGQPDESLPPQLIAAMLASHGWGALSLTLNEENGKRQGSAIRIETLHRAVDWLETHRYSDASSIFIYGSSHSGTLALFTAAKNHKVKGVIAVNPSSHIFQKPEQVLGNNSPVIVQGEPVPYAGFSFGDKCKRYFSLITGRESDWEQLYFRALEKNKKTGGTAAAIPAENINGPLLLISSKNDNYWPSFQMSQEMTERLAQHSFKFPSKHISLECSGHQLVLPFLPYKYFMEAPWGADGSGVMETCSEGEKAWRAILHFLNKYCPPAPSKQTASFPLEKEHAR